MVIDCQASLPCAQEQVKLLISSTQVAPFWQGLLAHSSMLMLHVAPAKPTKKWNSNYTQCSLLNSPIYGINKFNKGKFLQ